MSRLNRISLNCPNCVKNLFFNNGIKTLNYMFRYMYSCVLVYVYVYGRNKYIHECYNKVKFLEFNTLRRFTSIRSDFK